MYCNAEKLWLKEEMLTSKEINFFKNNGFLIKRKYLPQKLRNNFFDTFFEICKTYGKKYFTENKIKNWNSSSLNAGLISMRKKNPKIFSKIYDVIQKTSAINKIIYFGKLDIISSKLLKNKKDTICEINRILRMDPPNDSKNSLKWHEDGCYNNKVNDSVVAWCPMIDVNENNGTVIIMLKSHNSGNIIRSKFSKKNNF